MLEDGMVALHTTLPDGGPRQYEPLKDRIIRWTRMQDNGWLEAHRARGGRFLCNDSVCNNASTNRRPAVVNRSKNPSIHHSTASIPPHPQDQN